MSQLPPPLPRRPVSGLALAAIFTACLAALAWAGLAWQEARAETALMMRAALVLVGLAASALAALLGAGGLLRPRGRPISLLALVGSLALACLFAPLVKGALAEAYGQFSASVRHLGPGDPAEVAARQPIRQAPGALTDRELRPAFVAWGEEQMVQPYDEHGHHDPAWDDAARQLIRGSAARLTGSAGAPGPAQLRLLGRAALRAGCDDPWVSLLARRLDSHDPDFYRLMSQAGTALTAAGYAGFPVSLAKAEAFHAARKGSKAAETLAASCRDTLHSALAARPLRPDDYWAWTPVLSNEPYKSVFDYQGDAFCLSVESVPGVEEWFRLRLRGFAEITQAWEARGSGYANTVSPEQWREFGQHLAAARSFLERSWQLHPSQPTAAKGMMTVSLGSSGLAEMRLWFDRAVAARFDYLPAYDTMRKGLLPRWFGSEEALLAFGRTCLATQRFDTEVPWEMLKATEDVADERDRPAAYYQSEAPWADLKAMLDGYLQHGDPARRAYYLTVKAVLAQRRGLDSEVAQLLRELHYQIDPQAAAEWNLPVEWVGRMVALSGPTGDLALAAERQSGAQPEKALATLQTARKLPGLLPIATDYLDGRIAEQRATIALGAAPWRPLTPPADLAGWKAGEGEWKVIAPATLEVKPGKTGALLTCLQPVGDTWEMRGRFDLVHPEAGRAEAAIFCGPLAGGQPHWLSVRFWLRGSSLTGVTLARGADQDAVSKSAEFPASSGFLIRVSNHRLRVLTNDDQWFAAQPLPDGVTLDAQSLIGLGSTWGGPATVRFRDLEWRAPAAAPAVAPGE